MSSFTYVISSFDDLGNQARASNCYITLGGLPPGVRYFRCRVLNFVINTCSIISLWMGGNDSHYLQLVCDNLILNGGRSGNKQLNVITTYSTDNLMRTGEVFNIQNFNGKVLNFRLLDEFENLATNVLNENSINTVWTLTLELTPIDDCC